MISVRRQRLIYVVSDYVMLNLGWLVFTLIRYLVLPDSWKVHYTFLDHITSPIVFGGQIIIPLILLALYWISGYYNSVFLKSRIDEAVNTAGVSAAGALLIFFAVLINDGVPERLRNIEMIALLWLCLTLPVYAVRAIITGHTKSQLATGRIAFNTLIVGTGDNAIAFARRIMKNARNNGMHIAGLVSDNTDVTTDQHLNLPVFQPDRLKQIVAEKDIRRIIVMPHPAGPRQTATLINSLLALDVKILVTPDLYSLIVMRPRIGDVVGEPLVDISSPAVSALTLNCKRASDIALSALALIALSPLLGAVALAVRLDSKGPVIFRQERIGYRNHPFNILKFRTMRNDAEDQGPALSTADDNRITRVGRILRKYRLDELPQFWNVLRGDMSLVGPRPERQYYITQIMERAPYYTLVHRVRPGITSWGMVKYGYASSVDQMIERLPYDLLYLENVSLTVDMKILFHTVNTVLTGKGL